MMMCRVCGGSFEETELHTAFDAIPYGEGIVEQETNLCCPECGSQELCEEGYCCECATEVPSQELEDGLCRVCVEEAKDTLEWMWGMLSAAQQHWALHHAKRTDE